MRRPVAALALVAALLVAGCGVGYTGGPGGQTTDPPVGPVQSTARTATPTAAGAGTAAPTPTVHPTSTPATATSTPTPTDRTRYDIPVEGGSLPYDQNVTYARVQRLLGTNQSAPTVVVYESVGDAAGKTTLSGTVYLPAGETPEPVLAHEFAHSILVERYDLLASSPDEQFAAAAVSEGAATYIEVAYARRYLDRDPTVAADDYHTDDPARTYFLGRYYWGYRYVDARIDDPRGVHDVYRTPPTTSEQVLHGHPPGAEPPRNLTVVPASRNLDPDAAWRYDGLSRLGEWFLRVTLRTRLADNRAARAATGWGTDRLVAYARDGRRAGYVWLLRFDAAANATGFERSMAAWRASPVARGGPPGPETPAAGFASRVWTDGAATVDVRRVGETTVAVVVGPAAFVRGTNVSGGAGTVRVGVDAPASAASSMARPRTRPRAKPALAPVSDPT